jgi:hypothetical protein
MFLENSRYFNLPTMNVKLRDGRTVAAVQPRLLPSPTGTVATELKRNDRLDMGYGQDTAKIRTLRNKAR